jgi:hypothetical protein
LEVHAAGLPVGVLREAGSRLLPALERAGPDLLGAWIDGLGTDG